MGERFSENPEMGSEVGIEQAADALLRDGNHEPAIQFLQNNPDQTMTFCATIKGAYREGDNAGFYDIAGLLETIVRRLPR